MKIRYPFIVSNCTQLLFAAALGALTLCSTSCATKDANGKNWFFVPVNPKIEKADKQNASPEPTTAAADGSANVSIEKVSYESPTVADESDSMADRKSVV